MRHNILKFLSIAAVMAVSLPFLAQQTWGVTVDTSELGGPSQLYQKDGQSVGPRVPLRVQCWQFGREIIDESGLQDMSLKPLLEHDSVSFKREGTQGAAVHIISVDDTVCLVQTSR